MQVVDISKHTQVRSDPRAALAQGSFRIRYWCSARTIKINDIIYCINIRKKINKNII